MSGDTCFEDPVARSFVRYSRLRTDDLKTFKLQSGSPYLPPISYHLVAMAEKDIEYNVGGAGSESPDPYEISAENKTEVRDLNLC